MKKKYDPFDFVMEHGTLQIGTLGVTGLASRMPHSPQQNRIQSSMGAMTIIPTIHVTSGIFNSMNHLEKTVKKRSRFL